MYGFVGIKGPLLQISVFFQKPGEAEIGPNAGSKPGTGINPDRGA